MLQDGEVHAKLPAGDCERAWRFDTETLGRAEAASAAAPRRSLLRRVRWSLAIAAVVVEVSAFVAWRLWLRRGPHVPAVHPGSSG